MNKNLSESMKTKNKLERQNQVLFRLTNEEYQKVKELREIYGLNMSVVLRNFVMKTYEEHSKQT